VANRRMPVIASQTTCRPLNATIEACPRRPSPARLSVVAGGSEELASAEPRERPEEITSQSNANSKAAPMSSRGPAIFKNQRNRCASMLFFFPCRNLRGGGATERYDAARSQATPNRAPRRARRVVSVNIGQRQPGRGPNTADPSKEHPGGPSVELTRQGEALRRWALTHSSRE